MNIHQRKAVVIGDPSCGKTSLLQVYTVGEFPKDYSPTIFESCVSDIEIKGQLVELSLWDSAGQEEYSRIRAIEYDGADVVLICYSVDSFTSLKHVSQKWFPEIRTKCPRARVLLVGTKADLRDAGMSKKHGKVDKEASFVTMADGLAMARKISAVGFLECSAKTKQGVDEVFKTAAEVSLKRKCRMCGRCAIL